MRNHASRLQSDQGILEVGFAIVPIRGSLRCRLVAALLLKLAYANPYPTSFERNLDVCYADSCEFVSVQLSVNVENPPFVFHRQRLELCAELGGGVAARSNKTLALLSACSWLHAGASPQKPPVFDQH